MRLFQTHKTFWAALFVSLAVVVLLQGGEFVAHALGRRAAERDVAVGRYGLLFGDGGYPVVWRRDYHRLLQERYGIQPKKEKNGFLWRWSYRAGYDEAVKMAAKQKFGHDVFDECRSDAQKAVEERYK